MSRVQTPLKSWLFQASIRNYLNCVYQTSCQGLNLRHKELMKLKLWALALHWGEILSICLMTNFSPVKVVPQFPWKLNLRLILAQTLSYQGNKSFYYMANPVLGKSLCSDWFFLGQDFAVRTVSMETVQSVYFVLERSRQILQNLQPKQRKKVWIM